MRWTPGTSTADVEDRRGSGGGLGGLPIGRAGGLGGILIALVLAFLGGSQVIGGGDGGGPAFDIDGGGFGELPGAGQQGTGRGVQGAPDPDARLRDFITFVFNDVQADFTRQFTESGQQYQRARLVLFEQAVSSGCGRASAATGPFYCSLDSTIYLDLGFFQELSRRFQAPGDFAQAYVVAHEVAHHVQNQLGIMEQVQKLSQDDPGDRNELSIRQELQADCLAGVWAYSTYERGLLEEGDLEEGLTAASAVGDDRIQEQATGRINPESWEHGSSEQRQKWFGRGFKSGRPDQCDTFESDNV